MIVVIGLILLGAAAIVGTVGVLSNAGPTHQLTETFSVFGYHVTGSTGTLLLFGMVVGAVAAVGLGILLAGARRTAERGRDARRLLAGSQRENAFINRDRANLLDGHQPAAAPTSHAPEPDMSGTSPRGKGLRRRWGGRTRAATVDQTR